MPLLIDIGPLPEAHCNDCLEDLFKAVRANPTGNPDAIWEPHQNPFMRFHVEDVTSRLIGPLTAIRDALLEAMAGRPIAELMAKALATPWMRWDQDKLDEVKAQLEALPRGQWSYEEYGLLVDYLIQRYLPAGVIEYEAEYLSVRASLLGKMQARAEAASMEMPLGWEEELPRLVPTSFRRVPDKALSPIERAILDGAHARAAQAISDVTETARSRMKRIVIEHVQARVLGQAEGTEERLERRLFDEFADLNRDFRRIAVTEAGEAAQQGFVAAHPPGTRLQRIEAYYGACDWCRSINGKVFTVVDPAAPAKDGETEVWAGKTNASRSASPRKRVAGELIEREPHERWWVAAGTQHPHCRGTWRVSLDTPPPPNVDPDFDAWLTSALQKVQV